MPRVRFRIASALVAVATPATLLLTTIAALSLASCGPLYFRRQVTLEVVDGLTGEPAAGVRVKQRLITVKFELSADEEATTDEHGVARMQSICWCDRDSLWWIGQNGPTYDGVGPDLIPTVFRQVASGPDQSRYIVPAWPLAYLTIELDPGYRGLVAEWPLSIDTPRTSGWLPPSTAPLSVGRDAVAQATPEGAVAHPTVFGGIPGFAFTASQPSPLLKLGSVPLREVFAPSNPFSALRWKQDPNTAYAWEIDHNAPPEVSWQAGATAITSARPQVWFVGTHAEYCEWFDQHHLKSAYPAHLQKQAELDHAAAVTWASLAQALPLPTGPTAAPIWSLCERADGDIDP